MEKNIPRDISSIDMSHKKMPLNKYCKYIVFILFLHYFEDWIILQSSNNLYFAIYKYI